MALIKMPMATERNSNLLLLFLALLILIYVGINGREFYTRGEAREALVAQSMLKSGNWILPSSYNNTLPSKPPFLHWMISSISLVSGEVSEVTARLPSAIFFIIAVFSFYLFLERRYESKIALYSVLILCTSAEWYRTGIGCRVDMAFSAFMFMGLLSIFKGYEQQERKELYLGGAFLLGATLSKGPAAIVLSGIILLIFFLIKKENLWRTLFRLTLFFIPIFLLSFCWYFAAYEVGGEKFLNKIYSENIARFLSSMEDEPHKHSVFYLFGTIPLGLLPWTILLIPALSMTFIKKKRFSFKIKEDDFKLFALIIIITFITFFSIPASKRSVYLLPIYPFLSFFSALIVFHLEKEFPSLIPKFSKFAAAVIILLTMAASLIFFGQDSLSTAKSAKTLFYLDQVRGALLNLNFLAIVLLAALVACSIYLLCRKTLTFLNLFLLFFLSIASAQHIFVTHYSNSISPRAFAERLKELVPAERKIYTFVNDFYALSFYTGRTFLRTETNQIEPGSEVVIFKTDYETLLKEHPGNYVIEIESENFVEKPLKKLLALKYQPNT